jgi:hypothetical protein
LAACALLLVGFSLAFGSASADSTSVQITGQGWWSKLQNKALPTAAPAPPNVKTGQLNVEGGPNGAIAIAAFKATLGEHDTNPTLTLSVASDTGGSSAILLACLTGSAWTPTENGDFNDAPHVDTTKCVNAHRADDGKTFTVPLGALQFGNNLDVVLVPGLDPSVPSGNAGSTFELVFDQVAPTSIATTPGTPIAAAPALSGPSLDAIPSSSPTGAIHTGGTGVVPVVPTPAVPADKAGATATSPVQQAATAPQIALDAASTKDGRTRPLGILVLLAGAGLALWAWRSDNLARIAAAGTAAGADDGAPGGLGRFVRPRAGQPPALT